MNDTKVLQIIKEAIEENATTLDLSANQLTSLPKEIAELKNLTEIDLSSNQLPILPDVLERYNEPANIINSYLSVISGQTKPLNEAKVLFVGEAKVGKTSLMKVLVDGPKAFNPHEPQTHEINIQTWNVTADSEAIKLNLWDFGGQEILHSTHRVFLTERSLYILVLNCRDSEEQNRLEYWLGIIQSYGGNSPVILVGNHADQQPLDINRSGLHRTLGILYRVGVSGFGVWIFCHNATRIFANRFLSKTYFIEEEKTLCRFRFGGKEK